MATTLETMTDEQIDQLRTAAAAAGDILGAAVCAKASGEDYGRYDLTSSERARVDALSVEQARAEALSMIRFGEAE